MKTVAVRIREQTQRSLRELSASSGETMPQILERAVEEYRRKQLFERANAAWAALKADPQAWKEELEEREAWQALSDGVD